MEKMTTPEVVDAMKRAPEWAETGGQIHRTYQFKGFVEAMGFVNKVAEQAEKDQHHPDILIRWNKVTLTLSTHDAGGITVKDSRWRGRMSWRRGSRGAAAVPGPVPKKAKK